jgi:hypothetical protein
MANRLPPLYTSGGSDPKKCNHSTRFRFSTPERVVRVRSLPALAVRSLQSQAPESIFLPTPLKGAGIRGMTMDYAVLYSR